MKDGRRRDTAKEARMTEKRRFDALSLEEQKAEGADKRRRIRAARSTTTSTIPHDNQENIAVDNIADINSDEEYCVHIFVCPYLLSALVPGTNYIHFNY